MKKLVLIVLVMVLSAGAAFSQVNFGFGGVVGTKAGLKEGAVEKVNFGVNARIFAEVNETLGFTGGLTYYLPSKFTHATVETKMNYYVANASIMYYLQNDEDLTIYGLGGVAYGTAKVTVGSIEAKASEFRWEAGIGVITGNIFFEGKYDALQKQIVGVVGIKL